MPPVARVERVVRHVGREGAPVRRRVLDVGQRVQAPREILDVDVDKKKKTFGQQLTTLAVVKDPEGRVSRPLERSVRLNTRLW